MFAMVFRAIVEKVPLQQQDFVTWDDLKGTKVNTSASWNSIWSMGESKFWLKAVRLPLAIPKCSIFMWLAFKSRLLTKDGMLRFGMQTDPKFVLCNIANETINHLLMECPYSLFSLRISPHPLPVNWFEGIRVMTNNIQNQVIFLYLGVQCIAFGWKEIIEFIAGFLHQRLL